MKKSIYLVLFVGLISCQPKDQQSETEITETDEINMEVEARSFGVSNDGDSVTLYTLTNTNGMTMDVMDYGGIITSLQVPDRNGNMGDVVLGFEDLQSYLDGHPFFGALVGRYGNRIAGGTFSLDGEEFTLAKNNGENHLHGGPKGFDKAVWKSKVTDTPNGPMLELEHTSPHLDQGFPGELQLKVTYLLSNDNELKIDYQATTDRPTIVNMTQHSYFNLNPQSPDILDHELRINADQYLPVDDGLIPLGSPQAVADTPFDFTEAHPVGSRIEQDHPQLKIGGGYDHTFVLNGDDGQMKLAAILYDPATGREMTVTTTEPGVQFYTANFLDGSLSGKGKTYGKNAGLCLETHHFPDSPNQPDYPSVRLDPGEEYKTTTVFQFGIR